MTVVSFRARDVTVPRGGGVFGEAVTGPVPCATSDNASFSCGISAISTSLLSCLVCFPGTGSLTFEPFGTFWGCLL